jgi:drug/metabolite transporter (DMT)-like permease
VTPAIVALVLCAAILHASWNALLRGSADRLWSVTIMSFTMTAASIPMALLLPLPGPASWPYLCVSAALQVGYSIFLVLAYRHAELGQVYPIVRGFVPLLVTVGAAIVVGERPSLLSMTGIGLISFGIISLAVGKQGAKTIAIAAALMTGAIIASYTVTDGIGARKAGNPFTYSTWIFILYGILMPLYYLVTRGTLAIHRSALETLTALTAGLVQLITYVVVIWAFTLSPIAPISALRETSIVFAALIGRIFLNETLSIHRLASCVVIACGAFCLSYDSLS